MIKSKEDNPNGLYNKYIISRTDGSPINPEDTYFVLKLDGEGDPIHIEACRKAILKYASEIHDHIPQLSIDIREKYDNHYVEEDTDIHRICDNFIEDDRAYFICKTCGLAKWVHKVVDRDLYETKLATSNKQPIDELKEKYKDIK